MDDDRQCVFRSVIDSSISFAAATHHGINDFHILSFGRLLVVYGIVSAADEYAEKHVLFAVLLGTEETVVPPEVNLVYHSLHRLLTFLV